MAEYLAFNQEIWVRSPEALPTDRGDGMNTTCSKCGAPASQVFFKVYCSAECDTKQPTVEVNLNDTVVLYLYASEERAKEYMRGVIPPIMHDVGPLLHNKQSYSNQHTPLVGHQWWLVEVPASGCIASRIKNRVTVRADTKIHRFERVPK